MLFHAFHLSALKCFKKAAATFKKTFQFVLPKRIPMITFPLRPNEQLSFIYYHFGPAQFSN